MTKILKRKPIWVLPIIFELIAVALIIMQLLDPWTGLEWERTPRMYHWIAIMASMTSAGYFIAIASKAYQDTYIRPSIWLAVAGAYLFTALAFS